MKRIIIILTFFLIFINTSVYGASGVVKKDLTVIAPDGFRLGAVLEYPNIKTQREFKTVVLLHSLGYDSGWWESLPEDLLAQGLAVLRIDLRGHGKSVYNSKLVRVSWKNLTNNAYKKYPDDVVNVIKYVEEENPKRVFFNDWALVGSDIGASAGIISSNKMDVKPKTIVMLSPVINAKGLYIPVKYAEMNNVDVLTISGANDISSRNAQDYLRKFAQSSFIEYTSESKSSGMLLLKNDKTLCPFIASWINQYLK